MGSEHMEPREQNGTYEAEQWCIGFMSVAYHYETSAMVLSR